MGVTWPARRGLRIGYIPLPTRAQVQTVQGDDSRLLRLVEG